MARLRIFVSSTCYDLEILRSELRPFISDMGYAPVMSDYADILYDPRSHTHDSCLKEVPSCDVVVLIIGSRFGGKAIPTALTLLDFNQLTNISPSDEILRCPEDLSITQLEVLKAIEQNIPIYTFVDEKVSHDHHLYERNKDNAEIIDKIEFPSIQNNDTAKYIFEFINFLRKRSHNNALTEFSNLDDIKKHLTSQWSQLFQRLLYESRTRSKEEKRYRDFSERIEDLKAVILASLATPDLRATAKGAIQYRTLISFLCYIITNDIRQILLSNITWDDLLRAARIVAIQDISPRRTGAYLSETYLILDDNTFFSCRIPPKMLDEFRIEWDNFIRLEEGARTAIVDVVLESRDKNRFSPVRYHRKDFGTFLQERTTQSEADEEENG